MYLPLHFFLSYSREDEGLIEPLQNFFEKNDIYVWIDKSGLAPGTPNWERSLKRALKHSYGLILAATPAAADSDFVQAELAYAKSLQLPIIPVWLRGESWSQSVPMGVSQIQYVDLRRGCNEENLSPLLFRLKEVEAEQRPRHTLVTDAFDSWYEHSDQTFGFGFGARPYVTIQLDEPPFNKPREDRCRDERAILFDPAAYDSLQRLLDELYSLVLSDRFEALTYGSSWLLEEKEGINKYTRQGINPSRLLLPWEWLVSGRMVATSHVRPYWGRSPLNNYGLAPGSVWAVTEPSRNSGFETTLRESAFGVAVNNDALLKEIFEGAGKQPHPPFNAGFLKVVPYGSINASEFRHLVVALDIWSGRKFAGRVLRETNKVFDIQSLM
jgi:TIR domain